MLKNTYIWLPGYIKQAFIKKPAATKPVHIIFTICDHFEPGWARPGVDVETRRINRWCEKYVTIASKYKDSDGRNPRHSIFYPQEEYAEAHLDRLAALCRDGLGEVEIHLHHDNDTADGLKKKLNDFKDRLVGHGLLSRDKKGAIKYGFIHGNWALNNSRRDGRWCGVDNETAILRDTGCYADFTLPSAPSDTQTKKINSIYYAKERDRARSHDDGIDAEAGKKPAGDLLMIQGPLALNWKNRKWGVVPRIENSGISLKNPPTDNRIDIWVSQNISVKGRGEWIFVKVYTHGLQDNDLKDEFFSNLDQMFGYLETKYNDGINYKLHYVAAREMYNIIKAAEAGEDGEPGKYRDYELKTNIRMNVTMDYGLSTVDKI